MKNCVKYNIKREKMFKKLTTGFLIISLFNYLACTTFTVAGEESKRKQIENGTYHGEIYIVTTDNTRYHFEEWNYYIKNDTLHGNGSLQSTISEIPFEVMIPLEEIENFEVEEADGLATLGLIIGIAVLGIVILGTIVSVSVIEDYN